MCLDVRDCGKSLGNREYAAGLFVGGLHAGLHIYVAELVLWKPETILQQIEEWFKMQLGSETLVLLDRYHSQLNRWSHTKKHRKACSAT